MLDNNITGANFRTGTIYIGDIGKIEGALEVTGAVNAATAIVINNKISEIDIEIEDSDCIPLMFFSVKNTSSNADKSDISVVMLKNQTSTNAKIQINKNSEDSTDITLSILIVKPWMV
jgi:hypothetical protein